MHINKITEFNSCNSRQTSHFTSLRMAPSERDTHSHYFLPGSVFFICFQFFYGPQPHQGKVKNGRPRVAQGVTHSRNASHGNSDGLMLLCFPPVFLNVMDNSAGVAAEQTHRPLINQTVVFTCEVLSIYSSSRSRSDTCKEC